jgi:hypothetical protein
MCEIQSSVSAAVERADLSELIELRWIYTEIQQAAENHEERTAMHALVGVIDEHITAHLLLAGATARDNYQRSNNSNDLLFAIRKFQMEEIPWGIRNRNRVVRQRQMLEKILKEHDARAAQILIESLERALDNGERIYCEDKYSSAKRAGCLAAVVRFVRSNAEWSESVKCGLVQYAATRSQNPAEIIVSLGERTQEIERLQRELETKAKEEVIAAAERDRRVATKHTETEKRAQREKALAEIKRRCPQAVPFVDKFFAAIDNGSAEDVSKAKWQIERRDGGLCPSLQEMWHKFLRQQG